MTVSKVSLQKTIPSKSSFYTTGGDQTITIAGVTSMIFHSKKDLTKAPIPVDPATQASTPSDEFDMQILDLKTGTDEIVLRGWLEDDATDTAWEKFWRLRAMISTGGALTNLIIDNLEFISSADTGTAESGGNTTLTDTGKAWDTNEWSGYKITIDSGTGVGQVRRITSNTGTVITVTAAWDTNPDATSVYTISTQEAYLEDIVGTVKSDDTGVLDGNKGDGIARIEVALTFLLGEPM